MSPGDSVTILCNYHEYYGKNAEITAVLKNKRSDWGLLALRNKTLSIKTQQRGAQTKFPNIASSAAVDTGRTLARSRRVRGEVHRMMK